MLLIRHLNKIPSHTNKLIPGLMKLSKKNFLRKIKPAVERTHVISFYLPRPLQHGLQSCVAVCAKYLGR